VVRRQIEYITPGRHNINQQTISIAIEPLVWEIPFPIVPQLVQTNRPIGIEELGVGDGAGVVWGGAQ
jgi:hypothetical protein